MSLYKAVYATAVIIIVAIAVDSSAIAASNIVSGSTYLASDLGNTVNPDFQGGTLEINSATTITKDFSVENYSTNTIDEYGNAATMSGAFTGTGPLTFTDSIGGGNLTLTNSGNTYSGVTTINNGATLTLSGPGTISDSSSLVDNGTFDISPTTSGASLVSLSGSGTLTLGAGTLTLTDGADTFTGVISGTGNLNLSSGTEILTGSNTYTGSTSISAGTLALSGDGSIEASSSVTLSGGTFDISATTTGASIESLSGGGGTVQLGAQILTITNASGSFAGVIEGGGGLVLNGGTQLLSGPDSYTGSTVINAGTLEIGAPTIAYNISDSGTFAFDSTSAITMSGIVSGSGAVAQMGVGVTTITTAQNYTGVTTISSGSLVLSGNGSIAPSSNLVDDGTFDITALTGGTSITSLSGGGTVKLGSQTLTLTDATGNFGGVISGTGGLVLTGGDETLSGSSTYTGETVIASGTLYVAGFSSLATSSSVQDDSVLDVSEEQSDGNAHITSIVTLSGIGVVNLGANTLVLINAADTFSGVIFGTGGITIDGGIETLTGANTYTGITTVSPTGTLLLSGAGNLAATGAVADNGIFDISAISATSITLASLSGSGTVNLGANDLNLDNASTRFSGTILGTGGLDVSGGTQILYGTNSYTGGTTISSGATLQIGYSSASGSVNGNVTDNGTLAFARTDSAVFSGIISGTGAVNQIGIGTTALTADNTYTGGTTIAAGTLQLGNGGTTGSITGDVSTGVGADNGMLAFDRADPTTFGGTISGTGGVSLIGSGAVVLTAVDSYTGSTIISSSSDLVLGGSGSIAASSGITDNGILDVSGATAAPQINSLVGTGTLILGSQSLTVTNASGTFGGAISGAGGLAINGGTETLSGSSDYTGATTINGGTLAVNGSIASSSGVIVNSGGTLAGTGIVPAVTVNNGSTLAPGVAGAGTLNVSGSVAFASNANFVVNVNSASAGSLSISGAETLAGTLAITSVDGTYPLDQKLTVLTADGGVTGSFTLDQIQGTGANLSSKLSYDADDVYLQIDLSKLSPLLPSGTSANGANAIGGIDAAITAGVTLPSQFENLGNVSSATLQTGANQLAGEIGSDIPQASNALFSPFLSAIFDHISDAQPNGPVSARTPLLTDETWASGFKGADIISGNPDTTVAHKFKSNVTGFALGGDWGLLPNFILGAAVSIGSTNFRLVNDLGTGTASALQAGLYGLYQFSPHFYASFAGAFGRDNIATNRVITVSGTDDLVGKLTAITYGGRYETGVAMGWVTPYIALQDELSALPAYSEKASSGASTYALDYAAHTTNASDLEIGIRQGANMSLTRNWTLHLSDQLAWANNLSGGPEADAAFAALPSSGFTAYGVKVSKNSGLVSLGAGVRDSEGFDFDVHFDSAISPDSQAYTGTAELGFAW